MKKFLLLLSVLFVVSCSSSADEEPAPVIKYTLTTSASPATGGTISPASGQHIEGATVNITATPAAEYLFSSWSGATGTTATTSVVMNSNKTVTANFIKKKYALTTSIEGEGTVTEKVIKAGAVTDYNSGTVVELTATPKAEWLFKEWTGDLTGTDNPKQITIDKAKTVTAVFEEQLPFYLDANGVTIKARDWVTVGTTGQLGGVTYTAVDNTTLKSMADNDEDVTKVVTTLVTDMKELFKDKGTFNQNIGSWDVSKVTNMDRMFYQATAFNKPIGTWDVSKVTDMSDMFDNSTAFNQDIGSWDVSKVTRMDGMFRSTDTFNQDIGSWDVSKVTDMSVMFSQATTFNKDIGSWDTAAVTRMYGMFRSTDTFNQDIGSWDVSRVTNMDYMFLSAAAFNQDIGAWDVSNVTNMTQMFNDAKAFNQDLSKWCVTNITSEPTNFDKDSALTEANKPKWGTCPVSGNSYAISVSASSSSDYTLSGTDKNGNVSGNDPGLTFKVGDEVTFSVNAANHPFYLKTAAGTGTGNQINGVTNNGTTSGNVVWTPAEAGTYYYQCSTHSGMVGTITIEN